MVGILNPSLLVMALAWLLLAIWTILTCAAILFMLLTGIRNLYPWLVGLASFFGKLISGLIVHGISGFPFAEACLAGLLLFTSIGIAQFIGRLMLGKPVTEVESDISLSQDN